jgi:hypothetical protein
MDELKADIWVDEPLSGRAEPNSSKPPVTDIIIIILRWLP